MRGIRGFVLVVTCLQGCAGARPAGSEFRKCTSFLPNAFYMGAYKGPDNDLSPEDLNQDIACASAFVKQEKYRNGFVTVFGGANDKDPHSALLVEKFAREWTQLGHAKRHPIMSGGGGGIMAAAARGAYSAGGPSIAYTTYYGKAREDPLLAFASPAHVTDGLVFSSVAVREHMMMLHSAAIIIAPGGTGTEWETFQILEMIKSGQLRKVPVYVVGDETHWYSLRQRLAARAAAGALDEKLVLGLVEFEADMANVLTKLQMYFDSQRLSH